VPFVTILYAFLPPLPLFFLPRELFLGRSIFCNSRHMDALFKALLSEGYNSRFSHLVTYRVSMVQVMAPSNPLLQYKKVTCP
jgi:hypothetical protein